MTRFVDGKGLFGGRLNYYYKANLTCTRCGEELGDNAHYAYFLGKEVGSECFEDIEKRMFDIMPDLIAWYKDVKKVMKQNGADEKKSRPYPNLEQHGFEYKSKTKAG